MIAAESHIARNLASVEQRIADACRRAGRPRDAVTLVAVSKTRSMEEIRAAYVHGVRHFGENRVEELRCKVPAMASTWAGEAPQWHMIGHVQSRKARDVVMYAQMLHSLDSLTLAARLDRQAELQGIRLPLLVECNVSGEAEKYGFHAWDAAAWPALAAELRKLSAYRPLECRGLMTMAPIVSEPELARPYFARLRALSAFLQREVPELRWDVLSMGMTDDFEVAIEEGATLVRIGRAIFEHEKR